MEFYWKVNEYYASLWCRNNRIDSDIALVDHKYNKWTIFHYNQIDDSNSEFIAAYDLNWSFGDMKLENILVEVQDAAAYLHGLDKIDAIILYKQLGED